MVSKISFRISFFPGNTWINYLMILTQTHRQIEFANFQLHILSNFTLNSLHKFSCVKIRKISPGLNSNAKLNSIQIIYLLSNSTWDEGKLNWIFRDFTTFFLCKLPKGDSMNDQSTKWVSADEDDDGGAGVGGEGDDEDERYRDERDTYRDGKLEREKRTFSSSLLSLSIELH